MTARPKAKTKTERGALRHTDTGAAPTWEFEERFTAQIAEQAVEGEHIYAPPLVTTDAAGHAVHRPQDLTALRQELLVRRLALESCGAFYYTVVTAPALRPPARRPLPVPRGR